MVVVVEISPVSAAVVGQEEMRILTGFLQQV